MSFELKPSVIHQNGVEFNQEAIGDNASHVTCDCHVFVTFFVTVCNFELILSVTHQNGVEFNQEAIGDNASHVTCDCHVFVTFFVTV